MAYGTVKSAGITIRTTKNKTLHARLDPFDPMSGGSGALYLKSGLEYYFEVESVQDLIEKLPFCYYSYESYEDEADAEEEDEFYDDEFEDEDEFEDDKYEPASVAMEKLCKSIADTVTSLDEITTLEFSKIVYSWGYEATEAAEELLGKIGFSFDRQIREEDNQKKIMEMLLPGDGNQQFAECLQRGDIGTIIYEEVTCLHWQTKLVTNGYRVDECWN